MDKAIKRYFPIFVLPTLLAFTMGFIAPFLVGVWLSFCKFTTINDATFIGFSNYAKILTDGTFVHALWYTSLFTIVTVVFQCQLVKNFKNRINGLNTGIKCYSGMNPGANDVDHTICRAVFPVLWHDK